MTTLLAFTAVAVASVVGYVIGRIRPWETLADWADWEIRVRRGRWATTKPREIVLATAFALTQPSRARYAWRHRNDPPPPRSPAIKIRDLTQPDTGEA